ncbi:MAG: C39 family peptidase [Clostridiales bacterium]|jgi:Ca2+-binding EF-hand superfamily protein|nr:C39 family peptidase [Clostridiales bacterium]
MTNVDTNKLKDLISEHQRFQSRVESEQAVFRSVDNMLNSIRIKYTQGYVLSAVNTASAYVGNVKNSSAKLADHVNKKRTGLQSALEIYLDAERNAKNTAKDEVGAAKISSGNTEGLSKIENDLDNGENTNNFLSLLEELLDEKIIKSIFGNVVKATGKCVTIWFKELIDLILQAVENIDRFKDENGIIDWERSISQYILELTIDNMVDDIIEGALMSIVGAGLAAAGVVCGLPVLAVVAIAVAVGVVASLLVDALDMLCEFITGKDLDTLIADALIDLSKWFNEKIGDLADAIKDLWSWLTGGDSIKGKIDAIWAQANDRIRQAIIDTQYVVDSIINGMPIVGKCFLYGSSPALAGADFTISYVHYAALSNAGRSYASLRNSDIFMNLVNRMAVENHQALSAYIMDELAEFVREMNDKLQKLIAAINSKSLKLVSHSLLNDLFKVEREFSNFLDIVALTKNAFDFDSFTYDTNFTIKENIKRLIVTFVETIKRNGEKIEAEKELLKDSSIEDLYKMFPSCEDIYRKEAVLQLLEERITREEAEKLVFNADGKVTYGDEPGMVIESAYGGIQHAPLLLYSLEEDPNYKNFLKELLHLNSDEEIEKYLREFNKNGCGYISMTNTIFVQYAGRPDEFERIFGFPMYQIDETGTIKYNFEYLVIDLYNSSGNIGNGTNPKSQKKILENYLKSKGVKVSVTNEKFDVKGVEEALKTGQVIIEQRPVILYNMDGGKEFADAGHSIIVTGIDDNGNLIVSSWGKRYIIKPEDYEPDGLISHLKKCLGFTYLDYEVVTFE